MTSTPARSLQKAWLDWAINARVPAYAAFSRKVNPSAMLSPLAIAPSAIARGRVRNRKLPTYQRPIALFRIEAISFSVRKFLEYVR